MVQLRSISHASQASPWAQCEEGNEGGNAGRKEGEKEADHV